MASTTFTSDIQKFMRKSMLSADGVLQRVSMNGFNALIRQSQVYTGNFRSQWRTALNAPDKFHDPTRRNRLLAAGHPIRKPPIPPSEAIMIAMSVIPKAKFGDKVFITNEVPYGPTLNRRRNTLDLVAKYLLTTLR